MKLEHDLSYDASPAEVYAMLADPAFREEVCEAQGVLRHTVQITPSAAGMEVHIEQWQPNKGIPAFAQKFIGEEIHIVHRERWTSPTEAALDVSIPGKPGHMKGTVTLREVDGGTEETVSVDIKVNIPLVGGKLEKLIGDLLSSALRAEHHVGRQRLRR